MHTRQQLKQFIYGSVPFLRGRFPYFGETVYFPPGSHIFERACAEGIYEMDVLSFLVALAKDKTTYVDVGANIGLLSVPVLARRPNVSVISIEASPETAQYLALTQSKCAHRNRWTVMPLAVGATSGEIDFWAAQPKQGAFDGNRDTGRGGVKRKISVPCQTLDEIWINLGEPPISVIKMDIEGGETAAIRGARKLIDRDQPSLIIEWNRENLSAYGLKPSHVFELCRELNYRAYSVPNLFEVQNERILDLVLLRTENLLLLPID